MESLEFNKMAGTFLGTLLFTMALGIVTNIPFAREKLEKPGYDLPAASEEKTEGTKVAEATVPLPELLAKADPKKGEGTAKVCTACHSFEKGVDKPTGPNLVGVVGRQMGSTAFAGYSDTMKGEKKPWTDEELDKFLTKPSAVVAGTKMGFPGEKDPKKRADIIAYLNSLK